MKRGGDKTVVAFRHVQTQTAGPDAYMTALGDLLISEVNGQMVLYSASGRGGGVLVRDIQAGLSVRDRADFTSGPGLPTARQLHLTDIDGAPILLAAGRYGDRIEAWAVGADGTLGAARPLWLEAGEEIAPLAFLELSLGGDQLFVTVDRYQPGLQIWARNGDSLRKVGQDGFPTDFLGANSVFALAQVELGNGPRLLVLNAADNSLLSFPVEPGGALGLPERLDLQDGLFISTATVIEVVTLGGQNYALLGAAGSGSVTVVALAADGGMRVTDQVGDTTLTAFDGVHILDTVERPEAVYVLAGGTDNGLTLMALLPEGRLIHVATLTDELRHMALVDIGGLDMIWRDNGLDIFVTGAVLDGATTHGRGITQLRVDLEQGVPRVVTDTGGSVLVGQAGADLFVLSEAGQDAMVLNFEPGLDRLDLSGMARFYSIDDLTLTASPTGAIISVGGAQITLQTLNGQPLQPEEITTADLLDLWHISVDPPPSAPLSGQGTPGADLLEGWSGDDMLLGEGRDADFDPVSAQVFRLYQATLDRAPDLNGLLDWVGRLQSGTQSLTEVASGFTRSQEFRATYGATDDTQFVTLLYANVLDRAPDAGGLSYWVNLLSTGERSRPEVVIGFSESLEFRLNTEVAALSVSATGLQMEQSDEVYRLYRATLDREPDLNGFLDWTKRLAEGVSFDSVISGFVLSAEFTSTYGATDDAQFVTLLYANVLDRSPDAEGFETWTDRLATGWTREDVVEGFAQSREFRQDTAPDLRDWMLELGTHDVLDGAGGENVLMGGMFSDMFVFRASDNGQHVVTDLEPWDRLWMAGFGYDSTQDVAEHLRVDGQDVVFSDQDVSIYFLNVSLQDVLTVVYDF